LPFYIPLKKASLNSALFLEKRMQRGRTGVLLGEVYAIAFAFVNEKQRYEGHTLQTNTAAKFSPQLLQCKSQIHNQQPRLPGYLTTSEEDPDGDIVNGISIAAITHLSQSGDHFPL